MQKWTNTRVESGPVSAAWHQGRQQSKYKQELAGYGDRKLPSRSSVVLQEIPQTQKKQNNQHIFIIVQY